MIYYDKTTEAWIDTNDHRFKVHMLVSVMNNWKEFADQSDFWDWYHEGEDVG